MAQLSRRIKPLCTAELLNAMKRINVHNKIYFDVMSYDRLLQNTFPQNNFAIIFNTLNSFEQGLGHWCLLYKAGNSNEFTYLDSLNANIHKQVQILIESKFQEGDYLITNTVCLQKSYSAICGYICLFVLNWLVKGYSLNEIIKYKLLRNFEEIENEVLQNYLELI